MSSLHSCEESGFTEFKELQTSKLLVESIAGKVNKYVSKEYVSNMCKLVNIEDIINKYYYCLIFCWEADINSNDYSVDT